MITFALRQCFTRLLKQKDIQIHLQYYPEESLITIPVFPWQRSRQGQRLETEIGVWSKIRMEKDPAIMNALPRLTISTSCQSSHWLLMEHPNTSKIRTGFQKLLRAVNSNKITVMRHSEGTADSGLALTWLDIHKLIQGQNSHLRLCGAIYFWSPFQIRTDKNKLLIDFWTNASTFGRPIIKNWAVIFLPFDSKSSGL